MRRTDAHGSTTRLHLFNSQGIELANIRATNDRAWVSSAGSYDVGYLSSGDRIYFGVDSDGGYDYDATEISWEIRASANETPDRQWDSFDRDELLPVTYFESSDFHGIAAGAEFDSEFGPHPEAFNHLASYRSAGDSYPYAGRSSVVRGADQGESNAIGPFDVHDIQMHPPANGHSTIAAFHVSETGTYVVSNLAARRVADQDATDITWSVQAYFAP